jgi:predicted nucleic acid-binding protein
VKAVLDACVLYPTVLREILIGVAQKGLYTPLWSDRILEEWAHATRKIGPFAEGIARGEVAQLTAAYPKASIAPQPGLEARLHLPDENDIHVLAVAIAGSADAIITFNARDFPRHVLAGEGLTRRDPDGFLWELWSHNPDAVGAVIATVQATAQHLSGQPQPLRPFLKKAGLPRLAKAVQPG